MSKVWGFDHIKSRQTLYCGKNCMKTFCKCLREHTKNIIYFEKKKNVTINKRRIKSHQDAKVSYICRKRILKKLSKSISYRKNREYCHHTGKYRGEAHNICNLKFNVPNGIPVVFHNGSNYDYHFIIKINKLG